jgi:hypothetical protein
MNDGFGTIGRLLIAVGITIAAIGAALLLLSKVPRIGRLPGDIYIERGNWRFYFPLATSILLSLILSFILWLLSRRRM